RVTRWIWDGNVPIHEWMEKDPGAAAPPSLGDDAQATEAAARRHRAEFAARPAQGPPEWAVRSVDVGSREAPATWLFDPESFAPMAKLVGNARYSIVTDHLGAAKA